MLRRAYRFIADVAVVSPKAWPGAGVAAIHWYMVAGYHMQLKTTVYLDDAEYERLKAIARREGRKPAELVREAVAQYTARRDRGKKPRSIGSGRSGGKKLSERAEELLAGFGNRR